MKVMMKKWGMFLLCLAILLPFGAAALAQTDSTPDADTLKIPFTQIWEDTTDALRPQSVTVHLYKYADDHFDPQTAVLEETATVKATEDWQYAFDISKEALYVSSGVPYKWAIAEEPVAGYAETAHTDPSVTVTPSGIADWERITPCNSLDIPVEGDLRFIVAAKKGNAVVIWSREPLTQAQQHEVYLSAVEGIAGLGNPSESALHFISGYETFSEWDITVTEEAVQFVRSSSWSLLATGNYSQGSQTAGPASITVRYSPRPASLTIGGNKILNGWPTGSAVTPKFTFTLSEGDSVIDTAEVEGSGDYRFESILYTEAGEHTYAVRETAGTESGITYDDRVYTVTVAVADDGNGQLVAAVSGDSETGRDLVFTNTYIDEPDDPPQTDEPDDPPQTDEPDEPPQTDEPDEPPQTDEPDELPQTDEPDEPSQTDEPDEPSQTDEPDEPSQTDEPDKPSQTDETTTSPQTGETTTSPQTGDTAHPALWCAIAGGSLLFLILLCKRKPDKV